MNYVELHIGDYDKATAHLTACEDGIYGRMIRRYYDTEAPLPLDLKAIQRFVRARSRDEKDAVETLLEEFFTQCDDGWHHKRCDEEIARYNEKREKAQRSANARWNACERNANASRSSANGVRGNASSQEKKSSDAMRQGNNGINGADENVESNQHAGHANASAGAMRTHSEGNAHQAPDTKHQSPVTSPKALDPTTEENTQAATDVEAHVPLALGLRQAGFLDVTSMQDELREAARLGIEKQDLIAVAIEGRRKRKKAPGRWAITTAIGRLRNGEPIVQDGTATSSPNKQQQLEERNRAVASSWAAQSADHQEDNHAID